MLLQRVDFKFWTEPPATREGHSVLFGFVLWFGITLLLDLLLDATGSM